MKTRIDSEANFKVTARRTHSNFREGKGYRGGISETKEYRKGKQGCAREKKKRKVFDEKNQELMKLGDKLY